MPAQLPLWLKGVYTSCVITPGSLDLNGYFTPTGSQSLVGNLEDVDVDADVQDDNISPMDNPHAHHVPIEYDTTITLTEILKAAGLNILAYASWNYTHAYIQFVRGQQTWAGYFMIGNYNEGTRKGKSVGRLQLKQVIVVNQSNPTYG